MFIYVGPEKAQESPLVGERSIKIYCFDNIMMQLECLWSKTKKIVAYLKGFSK